MLSNSSSNRKSFKLVLSNINLETIPKDIKIDLVIGIKVNINLEITRKDIKVDLIVGIKVNT